MRKYLLLLFALIGGPALVVSGFHDYQNSKKLQAGGKEAKGTVLEYKETVSGKSRTHHYYLTVAYSVGSGSALIRTTSVDRETFEPAVATGNVKVHFLPSDPTVLQAGEKVETKTTSLIVGVLLSLGAVVGVFVIIRQFRQKASDTEETRAESIIADELKKAA